MKQSDHIEKGDDAFAQQLLQFKNAIGQYAATLELTPAQVAGQAADANYFFYALCCQESVQNAAKSWTGWKVSVRSGGTTTNNGEPTAVTLPAAVTPVAPGIEARFRSLVRQIKAHPNYSLAIGHGLDIEASELAAPDYTTLKPQIYLSVSGGHVEIDWGWQGWSQFLDMCELQVDRGDGKGFVLLTFDTTPGYTDPTPLPAAPVKWTYRAIYRVGDNQTGRWSNLVSIVVGG